MKNSIVADNTSQSGLGPDLLGTIATLSKNIVSDNTDVAAAWPAGTPNANGDFVGDAGAPLSPRVGALRENGGPTRTHAVLAGSLAIDAAAGASAGLDQRGITRPANAWDIGAYELAPETYTYWTTHEFPPGTPAMQLLAVGGCGWRRLYQRRRICHRHQST